MNSFCIVTLNALRTTILMLAALAGANSPALFAQTGYGQSGSSQPNPDRPAAKPGESPESIRQVISKPMIAAEKLIAEKKFQEALDQIAEAEKVDGKTPFERYVLDRMLATAALGVGNEALAVKSLESVFASGRVPAADALNFMAVLARIHYRLKDYQQAAIWAARAVKEPGVRIETRLLLGQSAYLTKDFATAKTEISLVVEAAEKAGKPASKDQLQLLASIAHLTNDTVGYIAVLEKLVVNYPKKSYWADLIYRVESKAGFADRLALDTYRLKLMTGVMTKKPDFLEMAALTLQSGYSADAQKVIDAGIAAGALAKDTTVDSEKKLMESIRKELADEKARAAKGDLSTVKSSVALLNNGFDLVVKGDANKGLEMMEAGLQAVDLRRPEEARLRYGIALVLAGQKAKASEIFKTVQGADGTAGLARLWDLYTRQAGA